MRNRTSVLDADIVAGCRRRPSPGAADSAGRYCAAPSPASRSLSSRSRRRASGSYACGRARASSIRSK